MKKHSPEKSVVLLILLLLSLTVFQTHGQDNHLPYSAGNKDNVNSYDLIRNLEITAGYLPKQGNEGLKTSLTANNVLIKRVGFYTSFEYALDEQKISNTCGGTLSLFKYIYVWGGIDVFTKNGLLQSGFDGTRKEAGIGITPYKFIALRFGYSNSVGPSFAAGIRIPL